MVTEATRQPAMQAEPLDRPSIIERLRFRKTDGAGRLTARIGDLIRVRLLARLALCEYYCRAGAEILRWKWKERATIAEVVEGETRFPGGRFAVFLIYQPHGTPWYVENALRALRQAGVNVLLVFNHPLDPVRLESFRRGCYRVMIRNNVGLDVGGYRDGYLNLRRDGGIERLLFLNDSVYFFSQGLPELFERLLASEADVSAPFENHQIHYHLQSFCLSLSRRMVEHPEVERFFSDYIPVSSRRWAIHKGEVALSRVLTSAARTVEIFYPAAALSGYRGPRPLAFDEDPGGFLPIGLRLYYEWLRGRAGSDGDSPLATIARLTARNSEIHTGGFLFRALLGSPLMKRDLVYREQFAVDELRDILTEIGDEGHLEAIVADSARRGSGAKLKGLQRGRYAAGMI